MQVYLPIAIWFLDMLWKILCDFFRFVIIFEELLQGMIRKMNWPVLKSALTDLNMLSEDLAALESFPETPSEDFLRQLHHILFEIHVQDGCLICPTTSRAFPVKDGIPNMLLHEDEV